MEKKRGVTPGLKRSKRESKAVDLHLEKINLPVTIAAEKEDLNKQVVAQSQDVLSREQERLESHHIYDDYMLIRCAMIEPLISIRGSNVVDTLTQDLNFLFDSNSINYISHLKNVLSKLYLLEDDYKTLRHVFSRCLATNASSGGCSPYTQILPANMQVSDKWYELMHQYYLLIAYADKLHDVCSSIICETPSNAGVATMLEISVDAMVAATNFAESIKNDSPYYPPLKVVYGKIGRHIYQIIKTDKQSANRYLTENFNSLCDVLVRLFKNNQTTPASIPKMYPGDYTTYGRGTDTIQ